MTDTSEQKLPNAIVLKLRDCVNAKWRQCKRTIVMAIGAKDTGKSTINKFIANTLLSAPDRPDNSGVYYLDGDVGQSEFTPSGILSLHKLQKPVLNDPAASQIKSFSNSYYYGAISPAADIATYKAIMHRLMKDFTVASEADKHSVIIVNTMGWVDNAGADILDFMLALCSPDFLLLLESTKNYMLKPEYKGLLLRTNGYRGDDTKRVQPQKQREANITAYFTQCYKLNTEVSTLFDATVRMVSFEFINIYLHNALIEERCYLAALNMAVVALCSIPDGFEQKYSKKRLLEQDTLPYKLQLKNDREKPFLACYGFALVRAICPVKRKIYIITPVDPVMLKKVTIFAMNEFMTTPQWIFQQNECRAPYLLSVGKRTSRGDTFNKLSMPLKLTNWHRRDKRKA